MAAQPAISSSNTETLSYIYSMVEAFQAFDSDNDGRITVEELGGIMSSLGYNLTPGEANDMLRRGDADGDGYLSIREFLEMNTRELDLGGIAGLLQAAYAAVEPSGEEAVTGEELHEVLSNMVDVSMEDCMTIVASMDGDGDGAVDIEDLRVIVQALL